MNEIAQPERETQKPVRRNPSIGDSRMRRMLAFDHSTLSLMRTTRFLCFSWMK